MDAQLQELIETIKAQGVESAEKQAAEIVAAAEESARRIVEEAREQAASIVEQANRDRVRQETAGKETLKQAARDLVLSVRSRLEHVFRRVVEEAVGDSLEPRVLENAIVAVVEAWAAGRRPAVEIVLGEADAKALEESLRKRLADELADGLEIRVSPAVRTGFRVSSRDGSLYYDFTGEAISEALAAFAGARLADLLREATGQA